MDFLKQNWLLCDKYSLILQPICKNLDDYESSFNGFRTSNDSQYIS